MGEMKWTPGPWRLQPDFNRAVVSQDGRLVADCRTAADLGEDRANARLIASAPDLFGALAALIGWDEHGEGEPFSARIAKAKAVLAKARGL